MENKDEARMIPFTMGRGDKFVSREDLSLALWWCPGKLTGPQKECMPKEIKPWTAFQH